MIHVYHGDGKGKTTAAMGLVLRAVVAGWHVVIVQFLKGSSSGEIEFMRRLPGVTVLRGKDSVKFSFQMDEAERAAAKEVHTNNLLVAQDLIEQKRCDLLVLDEALGALTKGMLDEALVREFLSLASSGPEKVGRADGAEGACGADGADGAEAVGGTDGAEGSEKVGGADGAYGQKQLELVLTGRGLPLFVEERADYITEMKCIRHPYERGVGARKGVEF